MHGRTFGWIKKGLPLVLIALTLGAAAAQPAAAVSFAPARHVAAGKTPATVSAADFDNDGKTDLAITNDWISDAVLLMGNGRGGFSTGAGPFATGVAPWDLAVADLNQDGNKDVVAANVWDGTLTVLLGDGRGGFSSNTSVPVGIVPFYSRPIGGSSTDVLAVGDVDNDGHADVVTLQWSADGREVFVLRGDGQGHLAAPLQVTTVQDQVHPGLALTDVNADGALDIAVGVLDEEGYVGVMLGDGAGHFGPMTTFSLLYEPEAIEAADMNGDGRQDLVVMETLEGTGDVGVLLGDGTGGFTRGGDVRYVQSGEVAGLAVADLDRDGHPDAATLSFATGAPYRSLVHVLPGNGAGGFRPQVAFRTGDHAQDVAAADFNGDGLLDLATADWADDTISVFLNGPRAAPVVSGLSPAKGRVGSVVTLTGRWFGGSRNASVVRFGAVTATSYVSWSSTRIRVRVPAGTVKGWVKVTVRTVAGRSVAKPFRRL